MSHYVMTHAEAVACNARLAASRLEDAVPSVRRYDGAMAVALVELAEALRRYPHEPDLIATAEALVGGQG